MIELLLQAAEAALQAGMTSVMPAGAVAKNYIGIQPQCRPPRAVGQWYVSLDDGGVTCNSKPHLQEEYTLDVCITVNSGYVARDRSKDVYQAATKSLSVIERAVIRLLHNVHTIRTAANTLGGLPHASYGDAFQQPLWYRGRGPTRFEDGTWNGCEPDAFAFAVRDLRFTGGLRTQANDIQH